MKRNRKITLISAIIATIIFISATIMGLITLTVTGGAILFSILTVLTFGVLRDDNGYEIILMTIIDIFTGATLVTYLGTQALLSLAIGGMLGILWPAVILRE